MNYIDINDYNFENYFELWVLYESNFGISTAQENINYQILTLSI